MSRSHALALQSFSCQVCGDQGALASAMRCPDCDSPHHADCWRFVGRCSTYGCPGRPSTLIRVLPDGPPTRRCNRLDAPDRPLHDRLARVPRPQASSWREIRVPSSESRAATPGPRPPAVSWEELLHLGYAGLFAANLVGHHFRWLSWLVFPASALILTAFVGTTISGIRKWVEG